MHFCGKARKLPQTYLKERIRIVSEQLDITSILNRRIETLSKGYKRRIGIAQAILHDPKVLILDEPTDGLDPNQKQHIRELINEIKKDKAIIISTHILEEAEAMCNRVVIINQGSIVVDSTPHDLLMKLPDHLAVDLALKEEDASRLLEKLQDKKDHLTIINNEDEIVIRFPRTISAYPMKFINEKLETLNIAPLSLTQHQERLETLFKSMTQTKEDRV